MSLVMTKEKLYFSGRKLREFITQAITEALAEVNNFKYLYIADLSKFKISNQDYKEGFIDGTDCIADTIEKNIKRYLEGDDSEKDTGTFADHSEEVDRE
jgi:hypothetical protein